MRRKKGVIINLIIFIIMLLLVLPAAAAEKKEKSSPKVTIMLFQTDLREALNEISMQTGVNIIPDQTVSGVVTADIKDVPLEKSLRMILIGGGYTYRKVGNFYLVGLPDPKNNTFGELSEVEVVKLKHVYAQQVFNVIPTFLEHYVKGDPESNLITVNAPPKELKRIKKLISKIDRKHKQIEIKVVVTEVESQKVKELGNTLLKYNQAINGDTEDIIEYNSDSNLLIIGGEDSEGTLTTKLLTKLKLMEEKEEAKIEADPKVLVSDGETAQLFIGDRQILLLEDEDNYSRVERIEVGVGLKVTPSIVGDNLIDLKLDPEISHFVERERPDLVVKENSVSTTLRLKSGQTALLAGMTLQNAKKYSKKVPILGDIPLVRWLFRNESSKKGDRELLMFVTPVIK